ncbi:hemolysin-coregulated protein [Gammaproteobacteria bacterium 45_16_T64]|nr:hemolysin-coregulated protein [Gammaproteobacteria bacterium 45_16_T64]OUS32410.1 hemolysin-coregulated protein [Gammaproteobacteria bacterium 45_16_T64]
MAIYLEFEGIEGNATATGYEKMIDVSSFNWGVGRAITQTAGRMANREASRPSISEITLTKATDKSTPLLIQESTVGTKGKKVLIHFVTTGGDQLEEFLTYTLEDTLISSFSIGASSDGEPGETISLSFSQFEVAFTEAGETNARSGKGRFGYDIALAKKS